MESLDLAIEELEAEVQRLKPYIERFQQVDHELKTLLEAKGILARGVGRARVTPNEQPPIRQNGYRPRRGPARRGPLTEEVIRRLEAINYAMTVGELYAALHEDGWKTPKNVLSSTLSQLVKYKRISRPETGKYAAKDWKPETSGQDVIREMFEQPTA